ncbi:hypothetical protein EV702DRAFT_533565 [Suillus placidus]|uniref:DUF6533 domain-containing protein n=1 Tax=Suillus placidus TaxID=48579 RepID=A0A9P6ZPN4_9AGAM|nr:hypothetical protein EV702DRAFT_533565 [Suillus placidus]
MEYSADDIAAATSLQRLAYLYMSMTTFWTYDYACSLHEEWKFLRRSRWTKVKALYIITRYLPFFLITMYLCLNFTPNENPNKCRILIDIYSSFSQISLICSECFFVLRTYALWNKNRIVLVGMLSTAFAMVVTSVGIRFTNISTSYVTTSAIQGIPGCSWSSSGVLYFMSFIFLFVFQLGLVSLTLIRVIQSWKSAKGHLHAVLLKHNIFYYACGLVLSAVNVLVPVLFPNSAYYTVLEDFQVGILAILATRMHLHLWHLDRHMHDSDALICISMSDMSPADGTV